MDRIERYLTLYTRFAAVLGVFFLLMVAGLSVLDIVVREATGRPVRGSNDIAGLLTIVIVAACFPAGLLERRQIKVTLLGTLLGPAASRVLDTIGALLTALMFVLIAYYVTLYAQRVTGTAQYTMVLNIPIGPWWWAAAICFWACLPAQAFAVIAEATGRPTASGHGKENT